MTRAPAQRPARAGRNRRRWQKLPLPLRVPIPAPKIGRHEQGSHLAAAQRADDPPAPRLVDHQQQILALVDPAEVLLRARVELHRCTGRPGDKLVLDWQDEVADALGYRDADALMADIAGAARSIAWHSDAAWFWLLFSRLSC